MSETNPKRVYLQIYDYETKEFSGLTTYHGLVRIFNSNTWPSRIFWSVVVLSCLSLFMIHSGYLLFSYYSKPTLFQINTIVPENGLIFPQITICNLNPVDFEKVNKFRISPNVLSYILDFYRLTESTSDELSSILEKRHGEFMDFLKRSQEDQRRALSIVDVLKLIGKTCDESILSCSFGQEIIENCCQHAITELTDIGLCYRFSNPEKKRQWFSGDKFGWEFVLDGRNGNQNDEALIDVQHGFYLTIHESEKFTKIDADSFAVPPDAMLHSAINVKNISLLEREQWGVCQKGWKNSEGFLNMSYTSNHCEMSCLFNRTLDTCGCAPLNTVSRFAHQLNITICSPFQYFKCYSQNRDILESPCDCDSECDFLEFDVVSSYSSVRRKISRNFNLSSDYMKSNISVASVYLRQVAYERHEQQKQLQTADLLSNIAGSMGLFLGMSTVTLLEIFIYLFKSVWGTVNSTRQRQFVESLAEEERERQQSLVILQDDDDENLEELVEKETAGADTEKQLGKKLARRSSATPIHIHLDRRNSRMLRGGDLFSAPRGSVSIPSQLLSPLSRHRKSISVGQLSRKSSMMEQHSSSSLLPGNSSNPISRPLNQSAIRRSSTAISPALSRDGQLWSSTSGNQRKSSVQFKTQLI